MPHDISVTKENTCRFPIHAHNTWEFMCYIKGNGRLICEDGSIKFEEGTVIAVPPHHKHGSESDNAFVNICIHTSVSLPEEKFYVINSASSNLQKLFEVAASLFTDVSLHISSLQSIILTIREMILEEYETKVSNSRLKAVYEKISENYSETHFNMTSLIESSGYSYDHFRILYRKCFGFTPKEHLDRLRMEKAMYLLDNYGNAFRICEIADMCGYTDSLYFSRKFKKYTGISPESYKKGHHHETD